MLDRGKKNLLGVCIDAVDYDAAVAKIIAAAHEQRPLAVSALAVHGVMTGVLDPVHGYRLNQLDLITPDGQPVRWALNWLYKAGLSDRVYGPTLMARVCERAEAEQLPLYLYGSRQPVLEALIAALKSRFPSLEIVGAQPSLFRQISPEEKKAVVERISSSGAALTLVGLGCPRQEVWVYEYREALSMPLLAIGAAFDFYAGSLPQAPARLQQLGLEWAFRLVQEPARLWKRYVLLNPLFIWLLFLQKTGLKRFELKQPHPIHELRYG